MKNQTEICLLDQVIMNYKKIIILYLLYLKHIYNEN